MNSIYFEDKVINFTDNLKDYPKDYCSVASRELTGPVQIIEKLRRCSGVNVVSHDPQGDFKKFCDFFKQAPAAGGVVTNDSAQTLMIYRNGRWDLPKGHIEQGEDPRDCAVREVSEECGLKKENLTLERFIATTRHIYRLGDEWVMKPCYWYSIKYEADTVPVPQTEEGITEVRWMNRDQLNRALKSSYATIRKVLEETKS